MPDVVNSGANTPVSIGCSVALKASIRQYGIRIPMTTYQGKILDGRNRHRAALKVAYRFKREDFVPLPQGGDPEKFVSSANAHRRQLDAEGRRMYIINLIESHPEGTSNWAIAKLAGCDDKTVGAVMHAAIQSKNCRTHPSRHR
jgi:hypothetical protein